MQCTIMSDTPSAVKSSYIKNTIKCVPEGTKNDYFTQPQGSLETT